jgi:hypothetical protein
MCLLFLFTTFPPPQLQNILLHIAHILQPAHIPVALKPSLGQKVLTHLLKLMNKEVSIPALLSQIAQVVMKMIFQIVPPHHQSGLILFFQFLC